MTDDFADELLAAALKYAALGWRVLQLHEGSKIPIRNDWPTLATTDPKTIRSWWKSRPHANVGIATGRASDLFVLDVDTKDGKEGMRSLKKLTKKYGDLPQTYVGGSPSGGLHFFFRFPKGEGEWRNSATYRDKDGKTHGPLKPDLDIRAEGGQVAAWPSRLSTGGSYSRLKKGEPVRPPKWLSVLTRYVEPVIPERPSIDPKTLSVADQTRLGKWTLTAVEGVVDDLRALGKAAVKKGESYTGPPWNNTSFEKACRLIELASAEWSSLSESDAYDLFFTNTPRDRAFTDETISTIWASARKRVEGKSLPVPDIVASAYLIPLAERGDAEPRVDPDSFFVKGEGLLAEKLADAVSDDLAIGDDGAIWAYRPSGVWRRDDEEVLRRVARLLGDRYRPAHYRAALDLVRSSPRLATIHADPTPDFLNTRSGMLDWRSGALVAHDPSYLSTVQLPINYDPEALCPHFDAFLAEVVPEDVIELVWEVIGYMLISGNPLQKAVLLYGDGGNGKGTLLRVLTKLLGRSNVSAVTLRDLAEGKFEVANLHGRIANIAGDIDSHYLKHAAQFKSLVGQDLVPAQRKYQQPFEFVCWAVPIFSANELWRSSDTTEGYFRRWVVIPFPTKVDGKLDEETLFAETPGILARALPALRRLMERGKFDLGVTAQILADDFREQSDLVSVWLKEDDHVISALPGRTEPKVPRAHVYKRFRDWASDSGHAPLSATKFYSRLDALDYPLAQKAGIGRVVCGITLDTVPGFMPLVTDPRVKDD